MVEQDKFEQDPTLEQIKQEIIDYVSGTKFGSPERQFVLDYLECHRLWEESVRIIDNMITPSPNKREPIFDESGLRINEYQMAILHTDIFRKKSTLPGYLKASVDLTPTLLSDSLGDSISDEVDPSLQGDLWEAAYKEIRKRIDKDIIEACLKPDAPTPFSH